MTSRASQRQRILELLLSARGDRVPLPQILELKISQFGARLLELRRLGYRIVNRTESVNGKKHSWYRLESRPTVANAFDSLSTQSDFSGVTADLSAKASSFPQFGNLAKEAGYPD